MIESGVSDRAGFPAAEVWRSFPNKLALVAGKRKRLVLPKSLIGVGCQLLVAC